ncbi:M24 family metallopeptidase [Phytomonospora endophytica]|uniref:Xaa-Pro aminopeptidase n=1 Tax=Phytomonospora endophytica TaxID=714109 RepID=A0A841FEH3_9ACTN|nr:Xaa-Pro peptidase family protein [Phytomonospora endophytica]MBB6035691.1 Xaa-Pro aminopeptidase [Phytomonospora endophytica]GIG69632.1 dipeptidase [Phytomonospora endophytica]
MDAAKTLYTAERLAAVRDATAAAGMDALVITPGAELRYLTGYDAHASERLTALLVPANGPATLIVPRLERPLAASSPLPGTGASMVDFGDGTDPYALLASLLDEHADGPRRVIGAAERMWAAHWHGIEGAIPGASLAMAGDVLSPLRMIKSAAEIAELARAAEAIDRVHARMGEWLRPGRTEREVAADISAAIIAEGHTAVSFAIVAAGPNGASPHHHVSDHVIERGQPVVVDIGGTVDTGYGSDCTRTYCVGQPPADFTEYYGALHAAHRAGVDAVRPGVTAASVDAATRAVLTDAGYGEYFTHRTGHGIGLDGHEAPYIVDGDDTVLVPGMAFSIEPGVYIPGRHGARIEDIVVCTDTGVTRLDTLPTEVTIL